MATTLALSACAVSAADGPTTNDDTDSVSAALTPPITFTATAAGGTVTFSPDGTRLATGSAGQEQAKVLSTSNGTVVQTFAVEGPPDSIAYSRDGGLIAIGSFTFNQNLSVFKTTGEVVFKNVSAHANGTTAVRFPSNNPTLLVTAGRDRMIKIWDTSVVPTIPSAAVPIRTINEGLRIGSMDVSPDGTTVAANANGSVRIRRLSDGTLLHTITPSNRFANFGIAFSPDGKLLSTGTQLFNVATGALVRNLNWPSTGDAVATTFNKSGTAVISGGEDFPNNVDVPTIRYFRVSDGATLATFDHLGGSNAYVDSVAISPSGTSLAYTVATDNTTVLATSPF